ncbi:MAG: pantoate--beta-alanine ligase [Tatlockia sp.]|nr:pantoate--beta-alanine ligase [Tatlockia sp.]
MQIFHSLAEWLSFRNSLAPELSLGFVPTMGNLHEGHLALYARSIAENEHSCASIFINPTQFNRSNDFHNYPRSLDLDLEKLQQAGVDYCLLPTEQEVYPDSYRFQLQETELCLLLEGKHRPGHFTGVLTVVMKLLNLVRPKLVYLGEKDYQQFLLIRDMAASFFMNLEVKACPTVREISGLAYSSRNNRLTASQRLEADNFAQIFHQQKTGEQIKSELEAAGLNVEYLEDYNERRYVAVMIGEIRLIDNYALG